MMILQALTDYYNTLAADPQIEIPRFGYSVEKFGFALDLSDDGQLRAVVPLFERGERKKQLVDVPRNMIVPARAARTGNILPNFLWDNSAYVLGFPEVKGKQAHYGADRFSAFRKLHHALLDPIDIPVSRAILSFLDQHDVIAVADHPAFAPYLERMLAGANVTFMFHGVLVTEIPALRTVWEEKCQGGSSDAKKMQCLVTGEFAPIARVHDSIQGVQGARAMGASLVSFNDRAYESFGKTQGYIAPVSEEAMFAYTTTLNYLLSNANPNRLYLAHTTVVYWTEGQNRAIEAAIAQCAAPPFERSDADGETSELDENAPPAPPRTALDILRDAIAEDENRRFYALGLSAPTPARLSVRFFISNSFGEVAQNLARHYQDLALEREHDKQPTYLSVRRLIDETVSKKAGEKDANPRLVGAVLRAVLENTPYPAALYQAIMTRIRVDQDDKDRFISKVNYVRTAIIKAYLIRKYRHQTNHPIQEVLTMALNEQSTLPAYVLGRLFAVLEKAQRDALGPNLNAAIKDRFFAAACATPATVFPTLLRGAQPHIKKAKFGFWNERKIREIMELLPGSPLPARLSLDDQGVFVLGYYHQRNTFYRKSVQSEEIQEEIQPEEIQN